MIKSKEWVHIILSIIILTFVINLNLILTNQGLGKLFLINTISIILVIFINIFAKKWAAYHFDANIEEKTWMWERFGFREHQHFKKPVPIFKRSNFATFVF